MAMRSFGDRRLLARIGKALLLANLRYWLTVAPKVRIQLAYWSKRAEDIPDPVLRRLALVNLREEGFNAQATATLATLAPRRYREPVAEAIVALQILYDYLDSLVERPLVSPIEDGRQLYRAFLDATVLEREPAGDYYPTAHPYSDGGYLQELVGAVRRALTLLPSQSAIAPVCAAAAERCAAAQVRAHAASSDGSQLQTWARASAVGSELDWREFLAGAVSSGLALHALIALAADPRGARTQARAVDRLYLSLCSVTTLLDALVDRQEDLLSAGRPGYLRYYPDREALVQGLERAIDSALAQSRDTPETAHHLVTGLGIVAYYASAPTAGEEFARPAMERVTGKLGPAIWPILVLMRTWRTAKRARETITSTTGHR